MWGLSEGSWGIVIAVVGVAVAIVVALAQRRPKILAWDLMHDEHLALRSQDKPDLLRVMWGNEPLVDPRIFTMRIENVGRRVILPSDYLDPVSIEVAETTILSVKLRASSKGVYSAMPEFVPIEGALAVSPPALNPREWFELQFVVDGKGDVRAQSRIAEETRRFQRQHLPVSYGRARRFLFWWGLLGIVAGAAFGVVALTTGNSTWWWMAGSLAYLGIGITGVLWMPRMMRYAFLDARETRSFSPSRKASRAIALAAPPETDA